MLSGLPVIGTRNKFNKDIINEGNGVLCNDTPESFSNSLLELWSNFSNYDQKTIKDSVKEFKVENCVRNTYIPVIRKITEEQKCDI